jgi:hypothetical protein
MAVTAKPPSYTVNTGHAKCPDHLWMCDEGTGTTLTDKGKSGSLQNLTWTNSGGNLSWVVDGTHGNCMRLGDSNTTDFAGVTSNMGITAGTGSGLLVMIGRWNSTTNPSATCTLLSIGNSGVNGHVSMQFTTAGFLRDARDDTVATPIANNAGTVDRCDNVDRLMAQKFTDNSGGAFPNDAENGWNLDTATFNWGTAEEFAIGCRCTNTKGTFTVPNASITFDVIAVMLYINDYATWDNTWISDLNADPWQFLDTGGGAAAPSLFTVRSAIRLGS